MNINKNELILSNRVRRQPQPPQIKMSALCESDIYERLVLAAISQLLQFNKELKHEYYIKDTGRTSYILFPRNQKKYMIKLCETFWTTAHIQLTTKEIKELKDMDGIIFMVGKRYPPVMIHPCEYTFIYVSSQTIQEEAKHNIKHTECHGIFSPRTQTFYTSRIFTYGELI